MNLVAWHTARKMSERAALPDLDTLNHEALKALIVAQHAQILSKDEQLLSKDERLASQEEEIERLKLLIAKLRRMQFGRKSEKLERQIEQLELRLDELEASRAEKIAFTSATPTAVPVVNQTAKRARQPLPAHLPRETRKVLPKQEACPDCGGKLKQLSEDVSETLEYVPEHFKVIRQVRPKLACACCDKIVQAEAASRPIARGIAGPGLLAHVLVSKYCDHLPLYRQSQIYARDGIELDRSTLAQWVGAASALMQPLVDALGAYVLAAEKLHADDTPVPVLAPGTGKTKQGRLWDYVRDDRPAGSTDPPAVWLRYSPDRKGKHPCEHLHSFGGILQADGYAGFNGLYDRAKHPPTEAACWAHARRKFYDLFKATQSPLAQEALQRIGALYAIEEQIRGQLPEERRRVREQHSAPLLADLQRWLLASVRSLSKKSELAGAIHYALARWEALCRFCHDGRIEIDNNAAERELRAV